MPFGTVDGERLRTGRAGSSYNGTFGFSRNWPRSTDSISLRHILFLPGDACEVVFSVHREKGSLRWEFWSRMRRGLEKVGGCVPLDREASLTL